MSTDDVIRQAFADLDSDNVTTRIEAIHTLGRLKVQDAVSLLVGFLPDSIFGSEAAQALIEIGSASVRDDAVLFQQPGFNAAKGATVIADEIVRVLQISPDREWAYVRTAVGWGWLWAALLMTSTPKVGANAPVRRSLRNLPGAVGSVDQEKKKDSKPDPEPEQGRLQAERRRGIPRELMDESG